MSEIPTLTVSQFIDFCNQSLEYAFPSVEVEGEVANFKVNQGKWVFFDLKDAESSLNCFLPLSNLGTALRDGMKVRVRALPKLTRWGKFSLTVQGLLPLGEGNIKKSFELLKRKLTAEGLFDASKKRPLPTHFTRIGVISSTMAAGYIDFLKILSNRWGGLQISTINTQVQGVSAPEQIVRALEAFNQQAQVEVIAILRGGGSADDLSAFNDECLVRAIAASRIPIITGIGHEIDESLADLAADVRASTPSNAAELLTPDQVAIRAHLAAIPNQLGRRLLDQVASAKSSLHTNLEHLERELLRHLDLSLESNRQQQKILQTLNPETVLERGYAIITGKLSPGAEISLTTYRQIIKAEVKHVQSRN